MGRRASDAEAQRILIGKQQSAKAPAADADLTVLELPDRKTLSDSADVYVKQKADANLSEAEMQARSVTAEFLRGTKKQFVDEITTEDITKFHAALRKRGCEPRTVANKHQRLVSWLKSAGVDPKLFPKRPVYEKTLPTIYNSEQIKRLLSDRNPYMHMAMLLALKLGLRDQELRHVEFSDIDEAERTLRVRGKPKWRFHVKAYQQRDIPIPDDLFDELMTWKKKYPKQNLILATRNGNPNTKLLLALKGGAVGRSCVVADAWDALNGRNARILHCITSAGPISRTYSGMEWIYGPCRRSRAIRIWHQLCAICGLPQQPRRG